ncbi:uncharacterized protein [Ptychodera flava]|uniref:uncharacterized protein n=1 Tax=Ptychodera flava TaxID=63121 RepID=UPI003969F7B7
MKSSYIGSSSESNSGEKVACASNVPVLKRGDPKRKVQICVIRSTSESKTGEKVAGASNLQVLKHSEPKRKMKSFIGSSSESNNGEKVVCASNVPVLKHSEPKSKIETCLIDSKSNGEKLPHARNVSALKCNVKIEANPETKLLLTVLETDNIPKKQEVWQKKLQSTDLYVPFSMLRFSSSSCQQNPDTIRSSNQANALDCSVFPKKKTGGNSCGIRKSNDSSCMDISQGIHSKDTQKSLFTKGNTTAIKRRRSSINSRDSGQCYVNETKCGESKCIDVEQSHVLTDNLVQDKPCLTKDVSDTRVAHSIYMPIHGNEPVGQDIPEEKGIPNSAEWKTEQNEHLALPDSAAGRKRTLPPEQVQQKSGSRQELIQQSNQVEIAQEKISGTINAELYQKSNGDHHDATESGSFMLDKQRFLPHMNASTIEIPSESDLVIKVENIPVGPKDSVKATGTKDSVKKKPVSTDELERAQCEPRSVRRICQRSSYQNVALSRKSDGDIASTYFYEPNYIQEKRQCLSKKMSSTRSVDMSCTSVEEREHLTTSSTGDSTTFNSDTLTNIVKGRENEENSDKAKTGAPLSSQVKNTPESRHTDAADSSVLSPETVERSVCVPKSGASKVLERRTSEKQGVGTDHEDFSGGYSCVLEDEEQRDCNSDSCVWHSCYCMLVDDEQLPYEAKEDDKGHSSNMSQEQLVTDVLSSPVEQVQDSSSRNPQPFAHSGRLKGSAEDLTVDSRSTEQQQCTQKGSNNGSAVEFMRNDLPGRQIEIPLTKRTGSSSIEVVFSNLSAKPLPFTRDERITDSGEVHTHHSLLTKPSLLVGDQRESDSEVKYLPPVVEYKLNNLSAKPKDERNSNSAEVQPMESLPLASNPVPRFKNESKNYSAHDHTDNASETLPLTMDESGDFERDHILDSLANKTSLFTSAQRRNDSEMECTGDNIPTIGKSPSTTNDHGNSNFAFESTMDVQEYGRDIGFVKQHKVENITHQPQSHKQDEVNHSFVCVALKQQQSKKHARPEPKRDSGPEKITKFATCQVNHLHLLNRKEGMNLRWKTH